MRSICLVCREYPFPTTASQPKQNTYMLLTKREVRTGGLSLYMDQAVGRSIYKRKKNYILQSGPNKLSQ